MAKIKLGIIDTGWPGQMHAKAIATTPMAQLYSCADLDTERRLAFETAYAPEKSFSDYHDLLHDPELDAVMVCLPNFLHFPAALAALEAGKHVFCEKPPTLNGAEMKVLLEEARKRGLIYFFGRQFRFIPEMRKAKELVAEGRLGKIYHAKATWIRSRGIPTGVGGWFTEKQRSGGGALIDIGLHALDSVWYLMGTPRPISVSAQVFRNFEHFVETPIFDVEDSAYAFIRFANDAVVQLETSWAGNLPDDIPLGKYFGRETNNSVLFGIEANLRLRPLTLFEDQAGELVTVPVEPAAGPNSFSLQLENFLGAIAGRTAAINDAEQAVALMEMIDAIYASSSLGREVPLA
ncbi:MAG: Gfo/Idh/MocA family oxidoreductase [Chthoniobacterales bacterium]